MEDYEEDMEEPEADMEKEEHEEDSEGEESDFGSDDLIFTWEFGDGNSNTMMYYNDGLNPDPYPSPYEGNAPFIACDTVTHEYGTSGTYTIIVNVTDDDGGLWTETYTIDV